MTRTSMNSFDRFCELVEEYNRGMPKKDHVYNEETGYCGRLRKENGYVRNYVYCYVDMINHRKNLISLTIFEDCILLDDKDAIAYSQDILGFVNIHNMANPNSPWEIIVRKLVRIAGEDFDRLVRQ